MKKDPESSAVIENEEILQTKKKTIFAHTVDRVYTPYRKVEQQVKVLIKHLSIFFLLPSKKFLPISVNNHLLETSPQKQKKQRQKQLDLFFFYCLFSSCTFLILCNLTFCQVYLLVKETAEIETETAEKSSWDQANRRQKLCLVWGNRKKISQNNQRLLLLTVLPLNYFMIQPYKCLIGKPHLTPLPF